MDLNPFTITDRGEGLDHAARLAAVESSPYLLDPEVEAPIHYCYLLIGEWEGAPRVIYVGETQSLTRRVNTHGNYKSSPMYGKVDSVRYFDGRRSSMIELEGALIKLLQPPYNKTHGAPLSAREYAFLITHEVDVKPFVRGYGWEDYERGLKIAQSWRS